MKKRFLIIAAAVLAAAIALTFACFAGTTPTGLDITISNLTELEAFQKLVNEETEAAKAYNVKLTADIDIPSETNWEPIGNDKKPFAGTFDGQGHQITGLNIEGDGATYAGLFGYIKGSAAIKNLGVIFNTVHGTQYAGAIVGYAVGSTKVENCYASGGKITAGQITGASAGGLIGFQEAGGKSDNTYTKVTSIAASHATSNDSIYAGAIVGKSDNSTNTNGYSCSTVSLTPTDSANKYDGDKFDCSQQTVTSSDGNKNGKILIAVLNSWVKLKNTGYNYWVIDKNSSYPRLGQKLTLDLDGGAWADGYTAPLAYIEGVSTELPTAANVTKSGFVLKGWKLADDAKVVQSIPVTQKGEVTAKAVWEAADSGNSMFIIPYATIYFDTCGGSSLTNPFVPLWTTVDLSEYVPTLEGRFFAGWYYDRELTKPVENRMVTVTGNMILYASYVEDDSGPKLPFEDVAADNPHYSDVLAAYEAGVLAGVSDTEFGGDGELTRAMAVQIMYVLSGSPEVPEGYKSSFTDLTDDWYADAVAWCESRELVFGDGSGKFMPGEPVTREELAAMLYRYARCKGAYVGSSTQLEGENVSDWAARQVRWAVATGLLEPRETGLAATERATRYEVAHAVAVLLGIIGE